MSVTGRDKRRVVVHSSVRALFELYEALVGSIAGPILCWTFSDIDKVTFIMSDDVILRGQLRRFSASEVGFFEGPEKLLEVWFDLGSAKPNGHVTGLRMIPR